MIKQIIKMSWKDGNGLYLDKKILTHLGVERNDLVVIDFVEGNQITIRKYEELIDEDTLNELLLKIEIDK